MPLYIVNIADASFHTLEKIDVIWFHQAVVKMHVSMNKDWTIPDGIKGVVHFSWGKTNGFQLFFKSVIELKICLLSALDWLIQRENHIGAISRPLHLDGVHWQVCQTCQEICLDIKRFQFKILGHSERR